MEPPPPFQFESDLHRLAMTGSDKEIYRHLGFHNFNNHWKTVGKDSLCSEISITNLAQRPFDSRPPYVPLYRQDLLDFCAALAEIMGWWSIHFATEAIQKDDTHHPDDFRSVVSFRTVEFMIRPLRAIRRAGARPQRIHIGWCDIYTCLELAMGPDPPHGENPQMGVAIGTGISHDPTRRNPDAQFEWRIDLALKDKVNEQVKRWRYSVCGGSRNYRGEQSAYNSRVASISRGDPPGQSFEIPNLGIQSQNPPYGEPMLGQRQPPREYGDDLPPPMVFSRAPFGLRHTFHPETRASLDHVHHQPQIGFRQSGGRPMPNPQGMPPSTSAPMPPTSQPSGPPGPSTSRTWSTERNASFDEAMKDAVFDEALRGAVFDEALDGAMTDEQRASGYPQPPYQGSQTDPQGEWADDGSEDPRGPYYPGGRHQSGSQGPYRGGGGHHRG